MEYIHSKEQIIDMFTKPLPKDAFEYLRGKLWVKPLAQVVWVIEELPCIKILIVEIMKVDAEDIKELRFQISHKHGDRGRRLEDAKSISA